MCGRVVLSCPWSSCGAQEGLLGAARRKPRGQHNTESPAPGHQKHRTTWLRARPGIAVCRNIESLPLPYCACPGCSEQALRDCTNKANKYDSKSAKPCEMIASYDVPNHSNDLPSLHESMKILQQEVNQTLSSLLEGVETTENDSGDGEMEDESDDDDSAAINGNKRKGSLPMCNKKLKTS